MTKVLRLLLTIAASAAAWAADWPCWRGPAGGGSQPDSSAALTADLSKAKHLWQSEYVEDSYSGAYSSPVVADGKVYIYFYYGDGKNIQEDFYPIKGHAGRSVRWPGMPEEHKDRRASPAADEVVLCVDAKTGTTIWKFVSPSTGLNHQRCNTAPHCTPCVGEGKVIVQGITGYIFCLDADSGKLAWQYEHPNYIQARRHRDACVATRQVTDGSGAGNFPFSAPVITQGKAVFGTRGGKVDGKWLPVRWEAYDLKSGKVVWATPDGEAGDRASPLIWRHGGKEYIIGQDKCLDPADGKILWTMPAGQWSNGSATPAIEGDYLLYSGGDKRGGPSGWLLSPQGPKKLWERAPDESHGGCGGSPGIHKGIAYINSVDAGGKGKGYVLAIDMQTGKEVARTPEALPSKQCASFIFIGDRFVVNPSFGPQLLFATGADLAKGPLSKHDLGLGLARCTTPALVDGVMFCRGSDGLHAYDLRQR